MKIKFHYKSLLVFCVTGLLISSACGKDSAPSTKPSSTDMSDMSDMSELAVDMPTDINDMNPVTEEDMTEDLCMCTTPENACEDGTSVRQYKEPGCTDGVCNDPEYDIIPCDTPPETSCQGNDTIVSYMNEGSCAGGSCTYTLIETYCDEPPANTCNGSTLIEYNALGSCAGNTTCDYGSTQTDCGAAGCCEDHCCEVTPSNDYMGTLVPTNINTGGAPSGVFNTSTDCTSTAAIGDCSPVSPDSGSNLCVCHVDSITINNMKVEGSRGLAILAYNSITIGGTLDVSATTTSSGPGASYTYTTGATHPAGGSFGSEGGASSASTHGNAALTPLYGGMRGQDSLVSKKGGGGGGALALIAGESITVTGAIIAGGGGGEGGTSGYSSSSSNMGGAGGGSGGGILLEAPSLTLTGEISANGGAGGSGGTTDHSGYRGADSEGVMQAYGGSAVEDETCTLYGSIYSGQGGHGATASSTPKDGGNSDYETRCFDSVFTGYGGGGGGLGRIRINADRGAQSCLCNGSFSPTPSFGTLLYD